MRAVKATRWRRLARIGLAAAASTAIVLTGATAANAAPPTYTALGDSYSSGVGTREYYDDGSGCQRSPHAYPVINAGRLGASLTFAACSGAKIPDVLSNQLGSLNASTSYVTISIGGNDAGFTNVIIACARPWPWTCWNEINTANAYITNTLPGRLASLYSTIRNRAPNARVVVVGYPRLFNGEQCNVISRISPGEQAELNKTADLLASKTAQQASAAGFRFVDSRSAFTGHAVCDDVEWINGASWPIAESYHPNRAGQVGYANLVGPKLSLRASNNSKRHRA